MPFYSEGEVISSGEPLSRFADHVDSLVIHRQKQYMEDENLEAMTPALAFSRTVTEYSTQIDVISSHSLEGDAL